MRFRSRHRQEEVEINLTSLIDVLFILLLFFMLSTTFRPNAAVRLQLPQAQTPAQATTLPVRLTVDALGNYYLDDVALVNNQAQTLKRALQQAVPDPARPLLIQADKNATHQAVLRVLDVAAQLGITQLSFAAEQSLDVGAVAPPITP